MMGLPVHVEMVELIDTSEHLLKDGHLILNPVRLAREQGLLLPAQRPDARGGVIGDSGSVAPSKPMASVSLDLVISSGAIEQWRLEGRHEHEPSNKLADVQTELRLFVFVGAGADADAKREPTTVIRQRKRSTPFRVHNVIERTLVLPKFAMFVPRSLVDPQQLSPSGRGDTSAIMVRKEFALPERANKLQVSTLSRPLIDLVGASQLHTAGRRLN
jgi:hypothetical protein